MRNPFGWSYPPGCSGPPEDAPERVCVCGHYETDHEGETEPPSGHCLFDGCPCLDFAMEPRAHVDAWYEWQANIAEERYLREAEELAKRHNLDL